MNDWVLLRGLARERAHWGEFGTLFERAAAPARVRYLDLPGFGSRAREISPSDITGIVEAVRAEARLSGPARVLGISLGGMVGLQWAIAHPKEIAELVLVNSSAGAWSRPWQRMRPEAVSCLFRAGMRRDARARESEVLGLVCNRPEARETYLEPFAALHAERPLALGNVMRQLLAARSFRGAVPPASVRGLVLAGAGDRLASPACSRAIAARTGWELRVHPDAGHDLPLDDPRWLVETVLSWSACGK